MRRVITPGKHFCPVPAPANRIAIFPVAATSVSHPACTSKKVIIMATGIWSSTIRILIFLFRRFTTHYSTIVKYTVNDFFL